MKPDPTRDVRSVAVLGEDASCRGWVRLDADRLRGVPIRTVFCITVDSSSYLNSFEARAFADALRKQADEAERLAAVGQEHPSDA